MSLCIVSKSWGWSLRHVTLRECILRPKGLPLKGGDSSGKNTPALHALPSGHAQRGKNDTLEALPRFIEKIRVYFNMK